MPPYLARTQRYAVSGLRGLLKRQDANGFAAIGNFLGHLTIVAM
jgi:hypothetical protein